MGLGIVIAVGGTPDTELSDAVSVEVFESMSEMTTFRIRYDLAIQEGDFPALVDARLDPGSEVAVIAPLRHRLLFTNVKLVGLKASPLFVGVTVILFWQPKSADA